MKCMKGIVAIFNFLYGNFHGLLDGVHGDNSARGISGAAESPGSLLMLSVERPICRASPVSGLTCCSYSGQLQVQSKEAPLLWQRRNVSEPLRQVSLRTITCLHLYSPCGLGPATQHGTWNWRVFLGQADREPASGFLKRKNEQCKPRPRSLAFTKSGRTGRTAFCRRRPRTRCRSTAAV